MKVIITKSCVDLILIYALTLYRGSQNKQLIGTNMIVSFAEMQGFQPIFLCITVDQNLSLHFLRSGSVSVE
jgi:hypothetical protein